jgi:lipoate---protein ligase
MKQAWRLLPFLVTDGFRQMAIDEAIFKSVESGDSPPTLRFYQWEPIAISLGYHQHRYPEHWKNLCFEGQPVDLVRRPTGGRAVLHQGDLTYAVITGGMPFDRNEGYRQICEFLIQGWRSLSFELSYGLAGRGYIHNPNCFGTSTGADLVLPGDRKFIGSAQKRSAQTILQHGSMQLNSDPKLFEQVFGLQDQSDIQALNRTIPPIEEILAALICSAERCFSMELTIGELTPKEQNCWEQILQNSTLKRSFS